MAFCMSNNSISGRRALYAIKVTNAPSLSCYPVAETMKLENHSMPSFYSCLLIGPAEVEWLLNHEMMLKYIRNLRASGEAC